MKASWLNLCAAGISDGLSYLFNKCLQSGEFPDDWKLANITSVHKGGRDIDVNNFRPISILPTIAKVFEKLIHLPVIQLSPSQLIIKSDSIWI